MSPSGTRLLTTLQHEGCAGELIRDLAIFLTFATPLKCEWVNVTNLRFCGEDGQRGWG